MAANGQVVTITTTATLIFQIFDGETYPTSPTSVQFKAGTNNDPLPLLLVFSSTNTIYLGGSGVTSSGGTIGALMTGVTTFTYNAIGNDSLYGIVGSGTQPVQLLVLRQ